ncbi:hypothetical protein ALP75_204765 [Pseudomonas syringae pv. actinidiae]|nr:hypothetical protein ALP75_204765 [Pseudomonas syringae pv. actinidiae]
MAAPFQHVHRQNRRIGHLHEEDLVAGDLRNRARVALERQCVEAVEQHTQRRMINLTHQVPDLLPGIDVLAPRQRFITDTQVAGASTLGQQTQVIKQNVFIAHRVGRGIAADQHQVGAQLLHQVEFAFGAVHIALQSVATATFKIAKWLEQGDGDTQVGA